MPGSIRVSVLEAVDLPAAAEEGECVSVKVSVGKMEFQTRASMIESGKTTPWNSDFAFPVLNLRDNLVVMLIGNKGEEISQNEIGTPSIVEKGFSDEFLTLKGGGSIHLRLNFVLTEEERQKIEMMRAAALKKREQEIARRIGNNQSSQLIEECRTDPPGSIPTMTESTTQETSRANTELNLAENVPRDLNPSFQNKIEAASNGFEEKDSGVAAKAAEGTELKCEDIANAEVPSFSPTPWIQSPAEAEPKENMVLPDQSQLITVSVPLNMDDANSASLPSQCSVDIGKSTESDACSWSPVLNPDNNATCSVSMSTNEVASESDKDLVIPADPVAIEEIMESSVSLSETSDSTNLTPSSVKSRVKAFERSLSQDAGYLGQLLPSSVGGRLQGQKTTEHMKSYAERNVEEKEIPLEKEKEISRNTAADVREEENKNVNSLGILDVAKQVLGGAVMVTVGILIWAAAANSSRRQTSIIQRPQRKK